MSPAMKRLRRRYSHIPGPLLNILIGALRDNPNDVNSALQTMRESSLYDTYFGGNRRDDGTFVMTEKTYYNRKLTYERILADYGLPVTSSFFQGKFADLVAGGKANDNNLQQFREDMGRLYIGVVAQAPQVRQFFMQNFGEGSDISDAAVFASALDTSKSPLVYENEIRSAQIGGAAMAYSFSPTLSEVQRLANYGLEQQAAQKLFADAAMQLPTYKQLAERHNDPDDDFDLNDYTEAIVIRDPNELRTMARLLGAENSLFRSGGSFATDESGRMAGLSQF